MEKKQAEHRRARTAGFTLVELMVVVAIIAILATTAGVYLFGALDDADQTKAKAEIQAMKSAITAYMLWRIANFRTVADYLVGGLNPRLGVWGGFLHAFVAFAALWILLWYMRRNKTFIKI